jgi:putative flippase GtrA
MPTVKISSRSTATGRFAAVGLASTLAYLALCALLRTAIGPYAANLLALVVTAVANTAANRRLTFGVRGAARAAAHHVQGLLVFGVGLALTTGALATLHAWTPDPAPPVELLVLVAASALATLLRFIAYRSWIFRSGGRDARYAVACVRKGSSASTPCGIDSTDGDDKLRSGSQ